MLTALLASPHMRLNRFDASGLRHLMSTFIGLLGAPLTSSMQIALPTRGAERVCIPVLHDAVPLLAAHPWPCMRQTRSPM